MSITFNECGESFVENLAALFLGRREAEKEIREHFGITDEDYHIDWQIDGLVRVWINNKCMGFYKPKAKWQD